MARISILIVDDHAIVRDGLRLVLGNDPLLHVCGEAGDGEQAAALAGRLQPDVVLLDMRMAGLCGAPAIRRVRAACPATHVLALSMHEDPNQVRAALAAGASGYVAKRSRSRALVTAIKAVASGERFVDPDLPARPDTAAALPLSRREHEVAQMIAAGHRGPEIARTLGISKSSVDTYRVRVFNKLQVNTLAELIARLPEATGHTRPPETEAP